MIKFPARWLIIDGLEDMDRVELAIDIRREGGGIGKAFGFVRAFTEEQDPDKQFVRVEFVFTRAWLEEEDALQDVEQTDGV